MHVRFWGTRGSIATPGRTTAVSGGNTACTEVRVADGTVIVLDCGTGARGLGLHLVQTMLQPMRLHLFIGHTHWDHIQGFPFFVPACLPGAELNVYAPVGFQRSLEDAMAGQMEYAYFPVKLRELRSRIHYTELDEGFLRVGDVLVETQYLNHTAPTIAYRLSSGGATGAYMTDHEPFWGVPGRLSPHPGDERPIAFMPGAAPGLPHRQFPRGGDRAKAGVAQPRVRAPAGPRDPRPGAARERERARHAARAPRAGEPPRRRARRRLRGGRRRRPGRGVVHRLPCPALQPTDAAGAGPRLALAHAGGRRRFPRPTAGPGRGCRPPVALRGPARVGAALRVTHERGARAAAGAGVRGSLRGGSLDPPGERSARPSLRDPLGSRAGARDHPQQPRRGDPERVRRG